MLTNRNTVGVKSIFVPPFLSNAIKKSFLQKTLSGRDFISAFLENKQIFIAFRVAITWADWTLRFDTAANFFLYPAMKKRPELQHFVKALTNSKKTPSIQTSPIGNRDK